MAAVVAFEVLPLVLLGPISGVLADRFARRTVMVTADLVRAGVVSLLVVIHSSMTAVFAVAFVLGAAALFFNPAASALVPDAVEEGELVAANTALWTTAVAAQIALAPLAGLLIAHFGVGVAFAINAASYVVSAAFLVGLRAGGVPAAIEIRGWLAVREGVRAVRSHPLLARLAAVQVLASLSAGATSGLLVVLSADALGVGPSGYGGLLAAVGAGALLGPLVVRRAIRPADRRWLFGPLAARGGIDLVLATTGSPLVAGTALAAYGVCTSTGMIAYQSTLQVEVPGRVRGRVFALFDVLWNSARLVSLGLGGLAADLLGIRAIYFAGGVVLVLAAAVGWRLPLPNRSPTAS